MEKGKVFIGKITYYATQYAITTLALYALIVTSAITISAYKLGVDTDQGKLISQNLPFRRAYREFIKQFPQYDNVMILFIEGNDQHHNKETAAAITQSLKAYPEIFKYVYAPFNHSFIEKNALLYETEENFENTIRNIQQNTPTLKILNQTPGLPALAFLFENINQNPQILQRETPNNDMIERFINQISAIADAGRLGVWIPINWKEMLNSQKQKKAQNPFIIMTKPKLEFNQLNPAQKALDKIKEIIQDPEITFAGKTKIYLTGEAVLAQEELQSVSKGAAISLTLSIILVTIILTIGMPNIRLIIPILINLIAGLAITTAITAIIFQKLNIISTAFAVLFVGLGIDFAIHYTLRCKEYLKKINIEIKKQKYNQNTKNQIFNEIAQQTTKQTGTPLLICAITTAIAFMTFSFTDFVGMAQLGFIGAIGMGVAFISTITLLPALIKKLNPYKIKYAKNTQKQKNISLKYIRNIIAAISIIGATIGLYFIDVSFQSDPIALKDQNAPSVKAFKKLTQYQDISPYSIEILAKDKSKLEQIKNMLKKNPNVKKIATIEDFIPKQEQQNKRQIRIKAILDEKNPNQFPKPPYAELPKRNPPIYEQMLNSIRVSVNDIAQNAKISEEIIKCDEKNQYKQEQIVQMAQNAGSQIKPKLIVPFLNLRCNLTRLHQNVTGNNVAIQNFERAIFKNLPQTLAKIHTMLTPNLINNETLPKDIKQYYISDEGQYRIQIIANEIIDSDEKMRQFTQNINAQVKNATGTPVEIIGAADVVAKAMKNAIIAALIAVAMVLFITLRKITYSLNVIIPVVIAALLLLLIMTILKIPFTFANVIVIPLIIGLGVDSGIHMVTRISENSDDIFKTSTPKAVTLSVLTTLASFGTLAISPHQGTATMGQLLTIAILITLATILSVIPAIYDIKKWKEKISPK